MIFNLPDTTFHFFQATFKLSTIAYKLFIHGKNLIMKQINSTQQLKKLFGLLIAMLFLFSGFQLKAQSLEDFETGDFSQFNWQFEGVADWTITSEDTYEGTYSARSGNLEGSGYYDSTVLLLTTNVEVSDYISFYVKFFPHPEVLTDSNYIYDDQKMIFYIDDKKHFFSSVGLTEETMRWNFFSFYVEPGIHTFKWEFSDPPPYEGGRGYMQIDNITFPNTETVAEYSEDFESGDFSNLNWVFEGNLDVWTVEEANSSGIYSASAGLDTIWEVDDYMSVTVDILEEGIMHWDLKKIRVPGGPTTTVEFSYDGIGFWLGFSSDTIDWTSLCIPVTVGMHTFKWGVPWNLSEEEILVDNIVFPAFNNPCNAMSANFTYTAHPENYKQLFFTDASTTYTSMTSWLWDFGDGTGSDTYNPIHTYADTGTYTVCLTVIDSTACTATYCEVISIEPLYTLGGTVFPDTDNQPIDEGFAYCYQMDGNQIVDVFSNFITDFGYYDFYSLNQSDYIIKAELSPNSELIGEYMPTYYGNVPDWVSATVIDLNQDIYDADIQLISTPQTMNGPGTITGIVYSETGNRASVANVQIILKGIDGEVLGLTYTDEDGHFSLNELLLADYKVLVEIIGKTPTPAMVTLTEQNLTAEVSFIIHDTEILLSVDDNLPDFINHIGSVFPNPAIEIIQIDVNLSKPTSLQLKVYNMTGQLIYERNEMTQIGSNRTSINISELTKGVYYLQMNLDGKYTIVRKFVKTQ